MSRTRKDLSPIAVVAALLLALGLLFALAAPAKAESALPPNYAVNGSNGIAVGFFQETGSWRALPAGENTEDYFGWTSVKGYAYYAYACTDVWVNRPGQLGWTFHSRIQHFQGERVGHAFPPGYNWKIAVHPGATCPGGPLPLRSTAAGPNLIENAPTGVAFGAVCDFCSQNQWSRLNPGENTQTKFGWYNAKGLIYAGNAKIRIWQRLSGQWVYVGCVNVAPDVPYVELGTAYSWHARVYPGQWC